MIEDRSAPFGNCYLSKRAREHQLLCLSSSSWWWAGEVFIRVRPSSHHTDEICNSDSIGVVVSVTHQLYPQVSTFNTHHPCSCSCYPTPSTTCLRPFGRECLSAVDLSWMEIFSICQRRELDSFVDGSFNFIISIKEWQWLLISRSCWECWHCSTAGLRMKDVVGNWSPTCSTWTPAHGRQYPADPSQELDLRGMSSSWRL